MGTLKTQHDLRDYQHLAIQHLLDCPRAHLWADMGTGKSVSTLTAFVTAQAAGEARTMLVAAPLRVAQSVWPNEPSEWAHLQHLTVQPIIGTPKQRAAAMFKPADIYTINYENLIWLVEQWGKRWPYDWVVTDEATRLKKPSGKRFRAAKRVHKLPRRWTHLTGTPASNGLMDLWAPTYLLDSGERLGTAFTRFRDSHFDSDFMGYRWEIRPGSDELIRNAISDITLSIRAEDYLDLHEPVHQQVPVALPPKAKRVYDDLERRMLAELDGSETVEAVSAAALTMKTRQVASGAVYTDDEGHYETLHDAKMEALQSIIEEAGGEPVLVAYHFKHSAERLQKSIKGARLLDKEQSTIDAWNAGEVPVLLAHPASCGHGLNLQHGGRRLVFFDMDWDLELHQQIIERIGPTRQLQAGYDRLVYIYHLTAAGTTDQDVHARLRGKATVQEALQNAMRRHAT